MNRRNFGELLRARGLVWLLLAFVLAFNFAIRWRLRDMPLERDEGEYAYAGQLLLQGIPPYQITYNMKFPGVYLAYAALMAVFGESTHGIHLGIMLVTSLTAGLVFFLGCGLLNRTGGLIAAGSCVLLSALPDAFGLAGHATHFVAFFATAGALALMKTQEKPSWFWPLAAGAAFGLAVLMKQHAAFFAALGLVWLAWRARQSEPAQTLSSAIRLTVYVAGCALPLLLVLGWLACAGMAGRLYFWTVEYASDYISIFPLSTAWPSFKAGFSPVFESSWGLWLLGLGGFAAILAGKRNDRPLGLAVLLFLGGMLGACPGFYFRGHYFLAAMPGLALLVAAAVCAAIKRLNGLRHTRWMTTALTCLVGLAFAHVLIKNCATWFRLTPDQASRRLYGMNPFSESIAVAKYLKEHTLPGETIAVLGSEPQIYFLARRHSASGYLYTYAFAEPQPLMERMKNEFINEIETARPRYVVFVKFAVSWFSMIRFDRVPPGNSVFDWWRDYSKNYEVVGAVDLLEKKPSEFFWDEQLANHTNSTPCEILVFRRRQQP